jgi:hypothetical protein
MLIPKMFVGGLNFLDSLMSTTSLEMNHFKSLIDTLDSD